MEIPPNQDQVILPEEIEAHEALRIEEFTLGIDQLPEISSKSTEGMEFWGRRQLRPDGEGSNYNNMPVLGFGVRFEGDQAVLSVPSETHLNGVVSKYNPGGFTFEEDPDDQLYGADEFLGKISHKIFPMSNSREIIYWGVPDNYLMFTTGTDEAVLMQEQNTSLYEHDRVDHMGIAALPSTEADKVASLSSAIAGIKSESLKADAVGVFDRMLDLISSYAIAKDFVDDEGNSYKTHLWEKIENRVRVLDWALAGFDSKTSRKMIEDTRELGEFALDREVFDQKIREMQDIKPHDQEDIDRGGKQ